MSDLFPPQPSLFPQVDPRDAIMASIFDQNITHRGSLVPLGRTATGETTFATPQFLVDMVRRFMLPGAALKGYMAQPNEVTGMALDVAGGGLAVGKAPAGSLASNAVRRNADALPMDEASRMARAVEQGYTVDAYHGSPRDLQSINRLPPGSVRASKHELIGESNGMNALGSWLSSRGDEAGASMYAGKGGAVYPVQARIKNPLVIEGAGSKLPDGTDSAFAGLYELIDKYTKGAGGSIQNRDMEPVRRALLDQGYDSVVLRNTVGDSAHPQDIYIMLNDGNIRSRFAAFDPARSDSADLLAMNGAGALPLSVFPHATQQGAAQEDVPIDQQIIRFLTETAPRLNMRDTI